MFFFDLPFGILEEIVADWDDRRYDKAELRRMLLTFKLINETDNYHVVFVCDWPT